MDRAKFKEAVLVILSFSLVLIFGCSENSSIIEPANQISPPVTESVTAEPNWFSLLPKPIFESLDKKFKSKKTWIYADKKSQLKIKKKYQTADGEVKVDIKFKFDPGTVAEDTEVQLKYNTENGMLEFKPPITFQKNIEFKLKFEGIDLTGINENKLKFMCFTPDGDYKALEQHKIKVDFKKGKVEVKEPEDPGFARYGFVR